MKQLEGQLSFTTSSDGMELLSDSQKKAIKKYGGELSVKTIRVDGPKKSIVEMSIRDKKGKYDSTIIVYQDGRISVMPASEKLVSKSYSSLGRALAARVKKIENRGV